VGFVRAGAAIFNDERGEARGAGDEGRSSPASSLRPSVSAIAKLHIRYGDNLLRLLTSTSNIRRDDILQTQILGWQMSDSGLTARTSPVQSQYRLTWSVDAAGHGIYQAVGQAQVYTGHAKRSAEITGDRIRIASPDFRRPDNHTTGAGKAVLITACGRCENTGMQFSADRRTVGRKLGSGAGAN